VLKYDNCNNEVRLEGLDWRCDGSREESATSSVQKQLPYRTRSRKAWWCSCTRFALAAGMDFLHDTPIAAPHRNTVALHHTTPLTTQNIDPVERYTPMSNALLAAYSAAGKNITFGACIWGVKSPWEWMGPLANHWRIDDDVAPGWDSVLRVLGNGEGLARFAGAGQWNDFDMLETGNFGLSDAGASSRKGARLFPRQGASGVNSWPCPKQPAEHATCGNDAPAFPATALSTVAFPCNCAFRSRRPTPPCASSSWPHHTTAPGALISALQRAVPCLRCGR